MSSFTGSLIIEPLDDGRRWKLRESFTYAVGDLNGEKITVPKGFITDFASVPRIFWSVIPPWGKYGKAAVLHDWLYNVQDRPRRKADGIFLQAMKVLKVRFTRRWAMYTGVRSGGWVAWRSHEKAKASKSKPHRPSV